MGFLLEFVPSGAAVEAAADLRIWVAGRAYFTARARAMAKALRRTRVAAGVRL